MTFQGFLGSSVVKNLPANTGDTKDSDLIPGSGRSPGGGRGNPLQYSCLENHMDKGAWQATVHRVAENWTQLKQLSMHTMTFPPILQVGMSLLLYKNFCKLYPSMVQMNLFAGQEERHRHRE